MGEGDELFGRGTTNHVNSTVRGKRWLELDLSHQKSYMMRLLDGLEVVDRDKRLKVARAILYLAQGNCPPGVPEFSRKSLAGAGKICCS